MHDAASTPSWWPPRNRRDIIRAARGAYEAHMEQMLLAYPETRMTPWDDQDAAVREAWIEHTTPEERELRVTDYELIVRAIRRAYAERSSIGAVTRWLELALEIADGNREDYPNEIERLLS